MAVPRRPTRLSLLGWSSIDRAEREARCLRPPGPWRCAERARGRPTGSHPRRPPRAVHRNRDTMGCTGRPGQCRVRRRAHRVPAGANRRWAVGVRVNAASLSEPTHSLAGNSPNRAGSGRDGGMMRISLPLHRLSIGTHPAYAEQQLVLIGQPRPIRIPEERWLSWLDNPGVSPGSRAGGIGAPMICAGSGWRRCPRLVTGLSGPPACPARRGAAPSLRICSPTNLNTG